MVIKFLLFIAYLIFAGFVLFGEVGLNSYGTKQGALNQINSREKALLDSVMATPVVKQRLKSDSARISALTGNSESQNAINLAAIDKKRNVINPHDESVRSNDSRVGDILSKQAIFVKEQKQPILDQFKIERELAQATSSTTSLGVAMPCLAIFLSLFSAWLTPIGTPLKQNYGLISSFVAQGASCIITFDAVLMQQNDWLKATAFSAAAFICLPSGHWLAGKLWQSLQMEWSQYRLQKAIIKSKGSAKEQVDERVEEESITHRRTFRNSKSSIEIPVDLDTAVTLYQLGKISSENGWSQRKIARLFAGGDLNRVHRLIASQSPLPSDAKDTVGMKQS